MKSRHLEYLGSGRTRAVYRLWPGGKWVLKVPLDEWGLFDNASEARQWKGEGSCLYKHQMARCRLLPSGCLLMEYVVPVTHSFMELPSWTYSVDCFQVGTTSDGRLVAYDYSSNLGRR